jgi:hypothetical protein
LEAFLSTVRIHIVRAIYIKNELSEATVVRPTLKSEEEERDEISVKTLGLPVKTTWRHNPQNNNPKFHFRQNVKSLNPALQLFFLLISIAKHSLH